MDGSRILPEESLPCAGPSVFSQREGLDHLERAEGAATHNHKGRAALVRWPELPAGYRTESVEQCLQECGLPAWNGLSNSPGARSAIIAVANAICAGSAYAAWEHASRNAPLAGFRPAAAPSFWPCTGAPRRCRSSLGYEQCGACLRRLGLSLARVVTLADRTDPIFASSVPSPLVSCRPVASGLPTGLQNGVLTCSFPYPSRPSVAAIRGCAAPYRRPAGLSTHYP